MHNDRHTERKRERIADLSLILIHLEQSVDSGIFVASFFIEDAFDDVEFNSGEHFVKLVGVLFGVKRALRLLRHRLLRYLLRARLYP